MLIGRYKGSQLKFARTLVWHWRSLWRQCEHVASGTPRTPAAARLRGALRAVGNAWVPASGSRQ